jgi:hypothetical protein
MKGNGQITNNGNGTKEKSGPHLRSQEMLEQPDESIEDIDLSLRQTLPLFLQL